MLGPTPPAQGYRHSVVSPYQTKTQSRSRTRGSLDAYHKRLKGFALAESPVSKAPRIFDEQATTRLGAYEPLPVSREELRELAKLSMRPVPKEILKTTELKPRTKVVSGDWTFYTSQVFEMVFSPTHSYLVVLALVPATECDGKNVLKRRFFMKSHSGGSWRASPYYAGRFSKGQGIHYTAETEPTPEIKQHLSALLRNQTPTPMPAERMKRYIDLDSPLVDPSSARKTMLFGFDKEVELPEMAGITEAVKLGPTPFDGKGKIPKRRDGVLKKLKDLYRMTFQEDFIPDFSRPPLLSYQDEHSLLGQMTLREYGNSWIADTSTGRKRPLIWTMAEDREGRAWIQAIRFADSPVSSYGSYQEVLDSGVLTAKPLEYKDQAWQAPEPFRRPFNEKYDDMTDLLALLPPIRAFRKARGLPVKPWKEDDAVSDPVVSAAVARPLSVEERQLVKQSLKKLAKETNQELPTELNTHNVTRIFEIISLQARARDYRSLKIWESSLLNIIKEHYLDILRAHERILALVRAMHGNAVMTLFYWLAQKREGFKQEDGQRIFRMPLGKTAIRLGREPDAVDYIVTNKEGQPDKQVSAKHATIRLAEDGRYIIIDHGSTNGTYVNGEKVLGAKFMRDGDAIAIGYNVFIFKTDLPDIG